MVQSSNGSKIKNAATIVQVIIIINSWNVNSDDVIGIGGRHLSLLLPHHPACRPAPGGSKV